MGEVRVVKQVGCLVLSTPAVAVAGGALRLELVSDSEDDWNAQTEQHFSKLLHRFLWMSP